MTLREPKGASAYEQEWGWKTCPLPRRGATPTTAQRCFRNSQLARRCYCGLLATFDCTLSIESWVEKLIRDAGEGFVSEVDPRDMAAFVLAVMEGAVMQARASRSIEPLDSGIETLRDYVRRVLKQKKETEQT